MNNDNINEYLFLLGKRPKFNKQSFLKKIINKINRSKVNQELQSATILNLKDTTKLIIKHISNKNFSSTRLTKNEALNEYYDAFNRFDHLSTVRNFITHGSPFRLSQQVLDRRGEIDDVKLNNYLENFIGQTYVHVDEPGIHLNGHMVSEDACLSLAYEVSKSTIDVMKKIFQVCYGDKPYGDGWKLHCLDYVDLLRNSGLRVGYSLNSLLKRDFPEKFTQSSPPSSSQ